VDMLPLLRLRPVPAIVLKRGKMRIDGKVVLITGASEGIGAACAASFRKRGARLSLMARSAEKLRTAGGPDALITAGDLTVPEIRQTAVAATLDRFGTIDILINNAGTGLYDPAWRAPLADARDLFELNFFAPLALTQLVAQHMRARSSGVIVNVSSVAGRVTLNGPDSLTAVFTPAALLSPPLTASTSAADLLARQTFRDRSWSTSE